MAAIFLFATQAAAATTLNTFDQGIIVMYRPSKTAGTGVKCPVRYRGKELVELKPIRYAEWHVAPGRYILTNNTASVEISVAPGETRYVRCSVRVGVFTSNADLQISDAGSFGQNKADLVKIDIVDPFGAN